MNHFFYCLCFNLCLVSRSPVQVCLLDLKTNVEFQALCEVCTVFDIANEFLPVVARALAIWRRGKQRPGLL